MMVIGLGHYLAVAAILFTLGIFGIFLNRKNVIVILMSIELILLAVNINLVAFSTRLGDLVGQVFALVVLTVAAAEAAIGLAILVVYFRNRGSIAVEDVNLMKGWGAGRHVPGDRLPAAARLGHRRPVRSPDRGASLRAGHDRAAVRLDGAVLDRFLPGRLRPSGRARRARAVHHLGRPARRMGAAHRHAHRGDARRRHYHLGLRSPLFDRLHGRGPASAALLFLPLALHLCDADAGDRRQPGPIVLRLGGRRPDELSADRLLVSQAR